MPLRAATTLAGIEERVSAEAPLSAAAPRAPWPDAVAYREAIQDPAAVLADPTLARAAVVSDRRGLPLAYTGRFAIVFRLRAAASGSGGDWAVRCFTSPETAGTRRRAAHYAALREMLERLRTRGHPAAAVFVPFRYLPNGIRVGGERFPLLAMQWAPGETLLRFVEEHRGDPAAMTCLCAALGRLLADLESAGIAHGDWQHDNLLVSEGSGRVSLVDYDGVLLPGSLEGEASPERGHPNYQHPLRAAATAHDASGSPDRFSCHVLQTALLALAADPTLWETFSDGDSILFTAPDFLDPDLSPVFSALRLVAFSSPALAASLTALEVACRAGSIADVLPPPFDHAAHAVPAPAAKVWEAAVPLATPPRTPVIPAAVSEYGERARHHVREARLAEDMWQCKERLCLWGMRVTSAYAAFLIFHMALQGQEFGIALAFGVGWICAGWFLWPTRRAAARVARILDLLLQDEKALLLCSRQLARLRQKIDDDPANASPVAFAGRALAQIDRDTLYRSLSGCSADDARAILRAGIRHLSDATGERMEDLPAPLRDRLLCLRQETIKEAMAVYQEIAERRRALRRECEALEAEATGFTTAYEEIRFTAWRIGDPGFVRFLGRVFGFSR